MEWKERPLYVNVIFSLWLIFMVLGFYSRIPVFSRTFMAWTAQYHMTDKERTEPIFYPSWFYSQPLRYDAHSYPRRYLMNINHYSIPFTVLDSRGMDFFDALQNHCLRRISSSPFLSWSPPTEVCSPCNSVILSIHLIHQMSSFCALRRKHRSYSSRSRWTYDAHTHKCALSAI